MRARRSALGARSTLHPRAVLFEAMVSSTGGALVALLIAVIAHWPMIVSPVAVLSSVGFAALVGVCFGYYPALKASRLNPIDARRFE